MAKLRAKMEKAIKEAMKDGLDRDEWVALKAMSDGLLRNPDGGRLVYYALRSKFPMLFLSFQANSFESFSP